MATCKMCKEEFWLDTNHESQNYGKKMDLSDHSKPHVCIDSSEGYIAARKKEDQAHVQQQQAIAAATEAHYRSNNGARNYYEEKEHKIEQLALAKIAALEHIATAIKELATAWRHPEKLEEEKK